MKLFEAKTSCTVMLDMVPLNHLPTLENSFVFQLLIPSVEGYLNLDW